MKKSSVFVFQLFAMVTIGIGVQTNAIADESLAKAKNCTACHGVDNKLLGPSFKDIAAKYKGDEAASATLQGKIKKGGGGVWGDVPMPPNPAVSDDEAASLVKWIMSL